MATASLQLTTSSVAPDRLEFGSQPQGSATAISYVSLTNTGGVTLLPTASSISGAQSGEFTVVSDGLSGSAAQRGRLLLHRNCVYAGRAGQQNGDTDNQRQRGRRVNQRFPCRKWNCIAEPYTHSACHRFRICSRIHPGQPSSAPRQRLFKSPSATTAAPPSRSQASLHPRHLSLQATHAVTPFGGIRRRQLSDQGRVCAHVCGRATGALTTSMLPEPSPCSLQAWARPRPRTPCRAHL